MVKMFDFVNWRNSIHPWLVHVGQACKMIQPKRDYLQQQRLKAFVIFLTPFWIDRHLLKIPIDDYKCHVTFSLWWVFGNVLGLRFCANKKDRTGGGGWVHPKCANSMAASRLSCSRPLIGTRRSISLLLCMNRLTITVFWTVGPSFLAVKHIFHSVRVAIGQELWLLKAC